MVAPVTVDVQVARRVADLREPELLHHPKARRVLRTDRNLDPVQRDFAAVRAGYVLVDSAAYDELRQRLEPATAVDRAFRHSARALLAFSAWRNGDLAATRRWSDMVLADPETPVSTRGQIEMLMALAGASDGKS